MKSILAIAALTITSITLTSCANITPAQRTMLEQAGGIVLQAAAQRVAVEISGK